jgi:hypothetical protein
MKCREWRQRIRLAELVANFDMLVCVNLFWEILEEFFGRARFSLQLRGEFTAEGAEEEKSKEVVVIFLASAL